MPINRYLILIVCSLVLSSCFSPPYNDFENDRRAVKGIGLAGGLGTGVGAGLGAAAGGGAIGAALGGTLGTAYGFYKNSQYKLLQELSREDIQYVEYGDTMTLIVPTDRYYITNTAQFNDVCFPGLNNIVRLLRFSSCGRINVAGFTDSVGSHEHKKRLSEAQAETMLTYLWANNFAAKRLKAQGFGDQYAIGDNHLIHGSAYNRRIEIQWQKGKDC